MSFSARFVLEYTVRNSISWKISKQPFVTFHLLWISNLTARNDLEILNIDTEHCNFQEVSRSYYEVKIIFSDNPSQSMLRPICKLKQKRTFTESLMADFVHFSGAIANFFLEQRVGTRLSLIWFWDFAENSSFPKILSLKSFKTSWESSHIQLLVIII